MGFHHSNVGGYSSNIWICGAGGTIQSLTVCVATTKSQNGHCKHVSAPSKLQSTPSCVFFWYLLFSSFRFVDMFASELCCSWMCSPKSMFWRLTPQIHILMLFRGGALGSNLISWGHRVGPEGWVRKSMDAWAHMRITCCQVMEQEEPLQVPSRCQRSA